MKVYELFESRESRSEFDWNQEMYDRNSAPQQPVESLYNLVNQKGVIVRRELTQRAAEALQQRPDLVKKYGRLFIKRI